MNNESDISSLHCSSGRMSLGEVISASGSELSTRSPVRWMSHPRSYPSSVSCRPLRRLWVMISAAYSSESASNRTRHISAASMMTSLVSSAKKGSCCTRSQNECSIGRIWPAAQRIVCRVRPLPSPVIAGHCSGCISHLTSCSRTIAFGLHRDPGPSPPSNSCPRLFRQRVKRLLPSTIESFCVDLSTANVILSYPFEILHDLSASGQSSFRTIPHE